jgi:hypothetical protein
MEVWNQLYYCLRDDGVFLPGRTLVPAASLASVLYS